jgi:streptogramin lyase
MHADQPAAPRGRHVTRSRGRRTASFAALASVALLAIGAGPAAARGKAAPPTLSAPIAQGLAGPLQLAVDDHGSVYVSQAFAGLLTKIAPNGVRTDVASNPGGEISGVDIGRKHEVFYTSLNADATDTATATALNRLRGGTSSIVRDILSYEQAANVDQHVAYGFETISPDCAAQWPVDEAGPAQYTGIVDSHPYSVAVSGKHHYIADAAANAIFDVSSNGHIRTVALLPAQPSVVTAAAATALHLPACVVGLTYDFEPVPTDVEIGRNGQLYVTTLPGGPEDPSLGARGSVYRINPHSGRVRKVAGGLLGATNLAIGPRGGIYVSELFGNRVSRIEHASPVKLLDLPSPAGLEYAHGKLYVGYDALANGTLATIDIGRGHGHDHGHHGHGATHMSRASQSAKLATVIPSRHRFGG